MDDIKEFTTVRKLEWARKKAAAREWITDKANKVGTFVVNHPGEAAMLASSIATVANKAYKLGSRQMDIYEENKYRERTIYDDRARQYIQLRRKPTNQQRIEFARRKALKNESIPDILRDMRLI